MVCVLAGTIQPTSITELIHSGKAATCRTFHVNTKIINIINYLYTLTTVTMKFPWTI